MVLVYGISSAHRNMGILDRNDPFMYTHYLHGHNITKYLYIQLDRLKGTFVPKLGRIEYLTIPSSVNTLISEGCKMSAQHVFYHIPQVIRVLETLYHSPPRSNDGFEQWKIDHSRLFGRLYDYYRYGIHMSVNVYSILNDNDTSSDIRQQWVDLGTTFTLSNDTYHSFNDIQSYNNLMTLSVSCIYQS